MPPKKPLNQLVEKGIPLFYITGISLDYEDRKLLYPKPEQKDNPELNDKPEQKDNLEQNDKSAAQCVCS